MKPTFNSFFSGIGCFDLAFFRAGWKPLASCEKDPFARRVFESKLGPVTFEDINNVDAKDIPKADVWVGGFPCQDLSSAGARKGFSGERSVLVFRLLELYRARLQAGDRPTLVLENVPGMLSVRGGRDFGVLLARLEDLGLRVCWRVLDARYFGVAQRRRRVFIVASPRDGIDPRKVLLEPESGVRDPRAGKAARERTAYCLATRAGGARLGAEDTYIRVGGSREEDGVEVAPTISSKASKASKASGGPSGDECQNLVLSEHASDFAIGKDIAPSLRDGHGQGQGMVLAFDAAYEITCNCGNIFAGTLSTKCPACGRIDSGTTNVIAFDAAQITHPDNRLRCDPGGLNGSLTATGQPMVATQQRIRRLTPTEAERLQGLPDGWTNIEKASDSARYKALGNGGVVQCMEWIARRLAKELSGGTT